MFIHLFVGEVDLGAGGGDQRELHSFRARPPRLKQYALHPGKDQSRTELPFAAACALSLR